jgi:hypothetical protein
MVSLSVNDPVRAPVERAPRDRVHVDQPGLALFPATVIIRIPLHPPSPRALDGR